VIVDASVLYQRHLRNALVWHSLEGLYELCWSALILDEVRRNLIARNLSRYGEERPHAVDRVLERMTSALRALYPNAEVPAGEVQALVGQMTNDPKDRHVLAAAVAAGARFVVTVNPVNPDALLAGLVEGEHALELCTAALNHHADFHGWTVGQLLGLLGAPHEQRPPSLPGYVRRYEELTGTQRLSPPT
jgi:predicted nucleic acid-binding protein